MSYIQTIYVFKQFLPAKRFKEFTAFEVTWNEVTVAYCTESTILKIEGNYYLYDGEHPKETARPLAALIRFKKGREIYKDITL